MPSSIDELVNVASSLWPSKYQEVRPGNLTRFIAPFEATLGQDPIERAPRGGPAGGTIYFESHNQQDTIATFALLGADLALTRYAVYTQMSPDPMVYRYLWQIRIVAYDALVTYFDALTEEEVTALHDQPLTVGELLSAFIKGERDRWIDDHVYSNALRGVLGGDDDWAKETLAYGFLVESTQPAVYRIWSRPWLVTK
ncbi:MAG: hypothetical protein AAF495_11560 [Pseudomonadota bacterium]